MENTFSNFDIREPNLTLSEQFEKERREWKSTISHMSSKIRHIDNLADLQVEVYSKRQEVVEYYHYLFSLLAKKNAEIRREKKLKLEYYNVNYDFKLDPKQKELYIQVDLEELYIIKDELDNHLKFISSTQGTIDNIIYGIKHRISIEEYKRRM